MKTLVSLIEKVFAFDKPYREYELLEREHGSPKAFSGWREAEPIPQTGEHDAAPQSGNSAPKAILRYVSRRLDDNEQTIAKSFSASVNKDIILRRLIVCGEKRALLVYMSGMADGSIINLSVLQPLMRAPRAFLQGKSGLTPNRARLMDALREGVVEVGETELEGDMDTVMLRVTEGMTALFVEGEDSCMLMETRGFEKRPVSTSENEKTVLGPRESFTECIRTNITLVRKLIHTNDLVAELSPAGGQNNTQLAIVYRKGVIDPTLLETVKRRVENIDTGAVFGSGTVEQLIENKRLLPVPQILSTERPDRVGSHVMQGRLCLLIDGSPLALIMPATLFSLLNSPEDVYMRKPLGTLIRLVRYAGAAISVLLPGYFLSLAMYHQGGLTAEVLSTVMASRKMVFEPIAMEMILLLLVFQLIREAGLRVPGAIGQAIGIIGGLIMGQAAVAANLASSVVLIIVALSGLGNFCIADYSTQVSASYFRLAAVVAAWIGGLVGIVSTVMLAAALLAGSKSFGVPFLTPFAPKTYSKRPFAVRGDIGMHKRADDYINASCDAAIGEDDPVERSKKSEA